MSDDEIRHWEGMGARFIQVNRSRSGMGRHQPWVTPGVISVEDADNKLEGWFVKARAHVVIVRPDRFVAAISKADRVPEVLGKLAQQLQGQ